MQAFQRGKSKPLRFTRSRTLFRALEIERHDKMGPIKNTNIFLLKYKIPTTIRVVMNLHLNFVLKFMHIKLILKHWQSILFCFHVYEVIPFMIQYILIERSQDNLLVLSSKGISCPIHLPQKSFNRCRVISIFIQIVIRIWTLPTNESRSSYRKWFLFLSLYRGCICFYAGEF